MTPSVLAFPVYDVGIRPPPRYGRPGSLAAHLGILPAPLPPQALAQLGFQMPDFGPAPDGPLGSVLTGPRSDPSSVSTRQSSLAQSASTSSPPSSGRMAPRRGLVASGYASADTPAKLLPEAEVREQGAACGAAAGELSHVQAVPESAWTTQRTPHVVAWRNPMHDAPAQPPPRTSSGERRPR